MPWAAQNAVFQRLAEVAEVSKLSKKERLEYDHALKRFRDTINAITGAEMKGRAEGRAEGLAKGLAKGRAEGREEGLAEGRLEGERANAIDTALRMKADGLPPETIAKYTGLSIEQINSL